MTKLVRYQCQNCGNRFEAEVLTPEEVRQRERERRPMGQVHCPRCNRTDVRDD